MLPPPNLGTISFCDRAAFNVKSDAFKASIVARLEAFGARILRRHVEPFTTSVGTGLQQTLRGAQVVCLRSHGNPYLLFFTRNEDGGGMVLFVDRKIQPGYTVPRIVLVHGRFDDALFNGTVVDGEMVKTRPSPLEGSQGKGSWVFLANDLLALAGRPMGHAAHLPARVQLLVTLFADMHARDADLDPCEFQVKRHEPLSEAGLLALRAFEAELSYPSRGMLVRPAEAPHWVRAKFLEYDPSLVVRRAGSSADKADADFRVFAPVPVVAANSTQQQVKAPDAAVPQGMQLRRTALPDVYDVHDPASGLVVGAAHVPSARLSADLREAFRGVPLGGHVMRNCLFRPQFCKWEPLI